MQRVSSRALLLSLVALVASLLVVFMLVGSATAPKAQAAVPGTNCSPVVAAGVGAVNYNLQVIYPGPGVAGGVCIELRGGGGANTAALVQNAPSCGAPAKVDAESASAGAPGGAVWARWPAPCVKAGQKVEISFKAGAGVRIARVTWTTAGPNVDGTARATLKPANNAAGVLSGLFDACAGLAVVTGPCTFNPSPANTLYACMVRNDEDSAISGGEQLLKSALECGSTGSLATGAGSPPTGLWHGPGAQGANPCTATVAGEGTCGARTGYSAGPPYVSLAPYKLIGFYCQSGPCTAPDGAAVPTDGTWQIGCLADFGTVLGPNVVVKSTSTGAVASNPIIGNSTQNSATVYTAATNAECTAAQAGNWDASLLLAGHGPLPLLTTLTRRDPTRKTVPGTCTDMQKLWENKAGTTAKKCPQDPFNPNAVDSGATDVSGTWDIIAEATRADVGAPGFYYNCNTVIQQTGLNLDGAILCVIDNPTITVNREAAGGNGGAGCPPDPKFCGDGTVGAAPPGCAVAACATLAAQGAGCPAVPCDVTQYQFADIELKHTHLTGVLNTTTNTMQLSGCFEDPEANGPLGNVFTRAEINVHTGAGVATVYPVETLANCQAGTPAGGGGLVQVASVRQNPGPLVAGTCIPNAGVFPANQGYSGSCRDSSGTGCPDIFKLGDNPNQGGLRDPANPWDWFNPEKVNSPHTQTVSDILKVVGVFGKDQGNAAYSIDTDRTSIPGGNASNLGPPDGKQTVADILASVKQFGQHCQNTF